jgi:hypothetical protein
MLKSPSKLCTHMPSTFYLELAAAAADALRPEAQKLLRRVRTEDHGEELVAEFSDDDGATQLDWSVSREDAQSVFSRITADTLLAELAEVRRVRRTTASI